MKIELDKKHYLNSDKYCYWISCEYKTEKGKGAGSVVERRVSGYMPTFKDAVESYIETKIKTSEAHEICKLKKEIEGLKAEVRAWEEKIK